MTQQSPPVLFVPLVAFLLAVVVAAGTATFMSVRTAHADIAGDCEATIAGQSVRGLSASDPDDAIDVDYNDTIQTTMTSAAGFESHKIKLRFLGAFERTVEEREDNGDASFVEEVDVSDYAWLGVGLYKVRGEANVIGGFTCSGAALVNVTGRNPLTTVAGGAAAAVAVVGTAGAAATGLASVRRPGRGGMVGMVEEAFGETRAQVDQQATGGPTAEAVMEDVEEGLSMGGLGGMIGCLCFAALSVVMVPLMALTGGGGAPSASGVPPSHGAPARSRRMRRARWLPRITLVGIVSGLLAGLAGVVLMQQFAIAYPSMGMLITFLIVGAVVYGVVVPTLGYTIGWLMARGR